MQRNRIKRLLFRMLLLSAIGWLISLARGNRWQEDTWEYPDAAPTAWPSEDTVPAGELAQDDESQAGRAAFTGQRFTARRVATSMAFTVLFFSGAAFTAGAGDRVARLVEGDECAAAVEPVEQAVEAEQACAAEAAPEAEAAPAESAPSADPAEAPAEAPADAPSTDSETASPAEPQGEAEVDSSDGPRREASAESAAPAEDAARASDAAASPEVLSAAERPVKARGTRNWVVKRARHAHGTAEIEGPADAATIWLNRALPDPTPPARRLAPRFARNLAAAARANKVDWALLLAVLRAQGDRSAVPATKGELNVLAQRLRSLKAKQDPWAAALALSGRTGFADRTMALTQYNRAVGLRALVKGLEAEKSRLVKGLLADSRASIYPGDRADLAKGRIDVRVVVLIRYLAESFDQVTVSSLFSGHRMYSRPGVVSAHIYGHAVDISTLGGSSIFGNQQPGGLTEEAVRTILLLPSELQPRQVISLLGLGGASFPMADHADHIHVGY